MIVPASGNWDNCETFTKCPNSPAKQLPKLPFHRYYEEDRLIENIIAPYPLEIGKRTALSKARPDLAAQWHYGKNEGYGPEDFSYGSNVKAWWQCEKKKKHIWQAHISNRTAEKGSNCPHCYIESYGLDLRQFPQVLKFFDKKNNEGIDPAKVGIRAELWWHCKKGVKHKWCCRFNIDVVDEFCPFCRGHKAAPDNNITNLRKLARQFHPTKNGNMKATEIVPGSKRLIWWKCPKGDDHEFQMRPSDRTIRGYDCPYCSRRRFSKEHSLAAEFPDIAKEWHKSKNGKLKPDMISSKSKERAWWRCPEGKDHEWEIPIISRTNRGSGCPHCANRTVSAGNNLAKAFPKIAQEFDLEKNKPVKPEEVIASSAKEYWWLCADGHSWKRAVYLRTKRGSRCPDCPDYGKAKIKNPLSKAFPEIAKHWDRAANGDLSPSEVSAGGKEYVWWKCIKGPDHRWQQLVQNITSKGYQCPFCEGYRVSVTNNLSLLYPYLAREWHPKLNELKATDVLPGSAYKAWWRCSSCKHEWQRECSLRSQRNSACPNCKGKGRK